MLKPWNDFSRANISRGRECGRIYTVFSPFSHYLAEKTPNRKTRETVIFSCLRLNLAKFGRLGVLEYDRSPVWIPNNYNWRLLFLIHPIRNFVDERVASKLKLLL